MPSLLLPRFLLPEMSDKKSPPHKEKPFIVRTTLPTSDEKGMKRKLLSPGSPTNDDDERKTPIKRKRGSVSLESSPIMGHQTIAKNPGGPGSRSVPLSERQQLAMIMRMADESTHGVLPVPEQDTTAKSPSPTPVIPVKKTPIDKKVHKRNERGELPIHLAAIKGDVKLLKKLIKAGADVNVADFAGWTPLHEASNRGWLYVAKQLLKAGANVNVQGLENDTPLHDASINGHRKLVELLLKHGANPLQANSKGKTPLDVAASQEMVKILKREIISSGSDSSSIEDTRSPMSQDSMNSMKDEERSLDLDELNNSKLESYSTGSSTNSRRMSMPKSPENKLASPRLCLKFQRDNQGHISQKFKDSNEPQYKSYSVTNVSVESTIDQMFSPVDSPASSADSDAYNPSFDGIGNLMLSKTKLILNEENPIKDQALIGLPNREPGLGHHSNPRELFPNSGVVNGRRTLENNNHQAVLNSVKENLSDISGHSSVVLKHVETQPFVPSAQWSDSHQDSLELPDLTSPSFPSSSSILSSNSVSVLDSSASSHVLNISESGGCNSVTSSSSLHVAGEGEPGPHLSMVTSTTGSNNLSLLPVDRNNKDLTTSVLSNTTSSSSLHSGSVIHTNMGTNSTMAETSTTVSNLKWELRSAASPKTTDDTTTTTSSSSHSQQKPSDSSCFHNSAGSPYKPDKSDVKSDNKESRPSTPKVPPLKIIIPTKSQASSSTDSTNEGLKLVVTNVKSALPYVINPYLDLGREAEPMEPGELMPTNTWMDTNSLGVCREQAVSQADFLALDRQHKTSNDSSILNNRAAGLENLNFDPADSSKLQERLNDQQGEKHSDRDEVRTDSDSSSKKDDKKDEPTQRVLRSAVRSQNTDSAKPSKQKSVDKIEKNSNGETSFLATDGAVTLTRQTNNKEEEGEEENVYPRKRKFKTKSDNSTSLPTTEVNVGPAPVPGNQLEKVPNSFDTYLNLRKKISSRRQNLVNVCPKIPQGYKDFLLNTSNYVLQGNTSSTLSVPTLSPPNSLKDKMRDMFIEQEEARYKLRLQHLIEREKLILSIEQEILREHGRAARAMANQGSPLSVCTILKDEEIYNEMNADQEEKEKSNRTRYNGRQFLSWLQDVDDKYDKIKEKMILRQKQEADSLYAIQKLEWEWRLKELGQCDWAVTPDIDELHVPLVQVMDNFDLLPT